MKKYSATLIGLVFPFTITAQVENSQDQIQIEKAKNEVFFPFCKSKSIGSNKSRV